jgi:preprotein translocase subunit SecD
MLCHSRGPSFELIYRLKAGTKSVTPGTRRTATGIVCKRLQTILGANGQVQVRHPRTNPRGPVQCPRRQAKRAATQIGEAGRLYFYDWEPNLIGPERKIGGHPGKVPPAAALRKASRMAGRRFALRDHPALNGANIVSPNQEVDEVGRPAVTFGFTAKVRVAFEQLARKIAKRGRASAIGPVDGYGAEAFSGHLATVFDGEVKTRPIIHFADFPKGIDGHTDAQISGSFPNIRAAQDFVNILRIGGLPINMALLSQQVLQDSPPASPASAAIA